MTEITCIKCKQTHKWDYGKTVSILIQKKQIKREIHCPSCKHLMTTVKLPSDTLAIDPPKNNVPVNETFNNREEIIKERLKSEQIICKGCNKKSGWYKNRCGKLLEEGEEMQYPCRNCKNIVLTVIGKKIEKNKIDKFSIPIKGYVQIKEESRKKPRVKKRVKKEKVPLLSW